MLINHPSELTLMQTPLSTARSVSSLARADNLSERIYTDLRARLQRCAIRADERLVNVELAAAYGTSRMPAREALIRLVAEGFLVGTTRGFTVPTPSLQDIRDIFGVRRLPRARRCGRRRAPHRRRRGERTRSRNPAGAPLGHAR